MRNDIRVPVLAWVELPTRVNVRSCIKMLGHIGYSVMTLLPFHVVAVEI